MSAVPLRLVVINSSVREGRFGPTVANWITSIAKEREELHVHLLDLAEHELPHSLSQSPGAEVAAELAKVSPGLAESDAFIVVTPEYNHSFPSSLKTLIDWHNTQWRAKPVGFVSYGGLAGGLRAVEQLRPVFAELHAVTVRDVVSFHNCWEQFDETGALKEPQAATVAAETLLDQLVWWGNALSEARTRTPYGT
ncbi:NADPH-dependent FMN reductase [Streptomyces sp. WI04-05B]|uniref:NADPH-dependent FMN reductase n=1 Tax=Streptomyces TaxID=1883 RepID=UPI0029B700C9|nr:MULTISPECIES: NAD(P)H-dependent oxidoreductase [unclassified Streptomyces]MDX2546551.1 NAD(P)H-dependent oxidoreductase [Streptomyces sp. WI04-05B]MDX2587817.1 NAD(P)H-dependent oxidoreductase [Streptomyces sp. WI04-05A]MDX3751585.1 NAD(P)H-dependent oxidoreductase [Streptomyces sp. AK08-02]